MLRGEGESGKGRGETGQGGWLRETRASLLLSSHTDDSALTQESWMGENPHAWECWCWALEISGFMFPLYR